MEFLIYPWANAYNEPQQLYFEWLLPECQQGIAIRLPVREYVADKVRVAQDTTTYRWSVAGKERLVRVAPFACFDNDLVVSMVERLFQQSIVDIDNWLDNRYRNDEMSSRTFMEARRYSSDFNSKLIQCALCLQRGTVLSQGRGSVFRKCLSKQLYKLDDADDIIAYDTDDLGHVRPIPLALHHQIEVAILQKINGIQVSLCKEMERCFLRPKPKPWYEIFLAFFVLLQNLDWIYSGALRYQKICEQTVRKP